MYHISLPFSQRAQTSVKKQGLCVMSCAAVLLPHLVREKLGVFPAVVVERHPFDETYVKLLVPREL